MDAVTVVILFLHMLGGTLWLGASLFMNLVALPMTLSQAPEQQRAMARRLIVGPEKLMIGAALGASVLGVVLGVTGRIRSLEALSTVYGLVWLAAIGLTVVVFAIGGTITSPAVRAFLAEPPPDPAASVRRLRRGFALEASGITAILFLMAVLRTL